MNESTIVAKEVTPFAARFTLWIVTAIIVDAMLHLFDLAWVGRYLGIPGTLLILCSFGYSLRKRGRMQIGSPATLLRIHEILALSGSMLVLVHAGIHFNAILPALATIAMLINVFSGLTGKFLLQRSRRRLAAREQQLLQRGLPPDTVERDIFWDAAAVDSMRKWRAVHFPITVIFAVLALGHIISIFLFWGWR